MNKTLFHIYLKANITLKVRRKYFIYLLNHEIV